MQALMNFGPIAFALLLIPSPVFAADNETEHPRHPLRRHRLGRDWLPRQQQHSHAEYRFDRGEWRPLHQRLRLRPVLQPDARRPYDRPLSNPFRPRIQQHARHKAACRSMKRPLPTGSSRSAMPLAPSANGTWATSSSSGRPNAASTSSTARSPTRRSSCPGRLSIREFRTTFSPSTDPDFYTTDAYADRAVEWIEEHKDEPVVSVSAIQRPARAAASAAKIPGSFQSRAGENRQTFAAMMSAMDDAVGKVLGKDPRLGPGREHAHLFPRRQRRPDRIDDLQQLAAPRISRPRPGKAASACRSAPNGKGKLPAGHDVRQPHHPARHLAHGHSGGWWRSRSRLEARRRQPAAVPDRQKATIARTKRSTGASASNGRSAMATGNWWRQTSAAATANCTTWPTTPASCIIWRPNTKSCWHAQNEMGRMERRTSAASVPREKPAARNNNSNRRQRQRAAR